MTRPFKYLYHLAEADNLNSILVHGLMSTERLLGLAHISDSDRITQLRGHRQDNVRLPNGVVIRDQRPMPPTALARALDDGLVPSDWYALLNSFVFLWPNRERMDRQRSACGARPQVVLTFDGVALLDRFQADVFVSPINSGNARRKAARRGRGTLIPYKTWVQAGWPTGQRSRHPAEFLFACIVPVQAPYLVDIARF
ncbi:MAG: uncharacterized protein JWR07_4057 [Nevskia sp.]|nr:uncharacterized protein [Nevskia sp.]